MTLEGEAPPAVSVVMANYNGAAHLPAALQSIRCQTLRALEIIVSDDASSDGSVAIVREAMRTDGRIRLIEAPQNGGPARARNRALEAARGEWIAIVDADDIIHPERFDRLLRAAAHFGADIVADDLLHFSARGVSYLLGDGPAEAFAVTTADWIVAGSAGTPPLGYVKPMIRRRTLGTIRYDETLRIGEDFDLVLRLLLGGARFQMVPEPWYLYRRHDASISHRLSAATMQAMIAAQRALIEKLGPFEPPLSDAFAQRLADLEGRLDYERLLSAVKRGALIEAAGLARRNPRLLHPLGASVREGLGRRMRRAPANTGTPAVLYLTDKPAAANPAGHPGGDIQAVPPYPARDATEWGRHRALWKRLATMVAGREAMVACDSPAGRYAAGFLPEARIAPASVAADVAETPDPLLPGRLGGLAPEGP